MKYWRRIIQNPFLYYGLSVVGWILSPHVYFNLLELIVSSPAEPDIRLVTPAWHILFPTLTFAYFSSAFFLRYIREKSKVERNISLILALLGCYFIPWQVDKFRNNVMSDGTFNELSLRLIVGGPLLAGICVGIVLYQIVEYGIKLSRSGLD